MRSYDEENSTQEEEPEPVIKESVPQLDTEEPEEEVTKQVEEEPDSPTRETVTLLDTEVFIFSSETTGQDYRIYVALPDDYEKMAALSTTYPVIYMLDANWHFAIVAGITRLLANVTGELNKVIVVGIGYPFDSNDSLAALRETDMLPGKGAEDSLKFIQEELMPYVTENYRTDPDARTLAGHSYGGLFTIYTLFTTPQTFNNYIAMSPALWWDGDGIKDMFSLEEVYAAEHETLPVKLFLSAGELEPEDKWDLWMVTNLDEFHQVLVDRDYDELEMDMMIIEGVNHASSFPGAVTRGLVTFFPVSP